EGTDRREKINDLTDTGKQTVSSVEQGVLEGRHRLFLAIDGADLETTRSVMQQLFSTLESRDGALWADTDGADSHACNTNTAPAIVAAGAGNFERHTGYAYVRAGHAGCCGRSWRQHERHANDDQPVYSRLGLRPVDLWSAV